MLTKTRAASLRAIKRRAEEMDQDQAQSRRDMSDSEVAVSALLVMGNDYNNLRRAYLSLGPSADDAYADVIGYAVNMGALAVRLLDVVAPAEEAGDGGTAAEEADGGAVIQKAPEIEVGDLVHLKHPSVERTAFEVVELTPIAGATSIVTLQSTEDDSAPFDAAADLIVLASAKTGNPPGAAWFTRLNQRLGAVGGMREVIKRGERVTGHSFADVSKIADILDALSNAKTQGDVEAIVRQLERSNPTSAALRA